MPGQKQAVIWRTWLEEHLLVDDGDVRPRRPAPDLEPGELGDAVERLRTYARVVEERHGPSREGETSKTLALGFDSSEKLDEHLPVHEDLVREALVGLELPETKLFLVRE